MATRIAIAETIKRNGRRRCVGVVKGTRSSRQGAVIVAKFGCCGCLEVRRRGRVVDLRKAEIRLDGSRQGDDLRPARLAGCVCGRRPSPRHGRGPAPCDERPPRRSDRIRPPAGRDGRGMVQRGALLAGSTSLAIDSVSPSRASARLGRLSLQGASDPRLHSIGVLAIRRRSPRLLCHLRVPRGSCCGWLARRCSRDGARTTVIVLSSAPLLAGRDGGRAIAGCNAGCPANGFMIADRPTIADGSAGTFVLLTLAL